MSSTFIKATDFHVHIYNESRRAYIFRFFFFYKKTFLMSATVSNIFCSSLCNAGVKSRVTMRVHAMTVG